MLNRKYKEYKIQNTEHTMQVWYYKKWSMNIYKIQNTKHMMQVWYCCVWSGNSVNIGATPTKVGAKESS